MSDKDDAFMLGELKADMRNLTGAVKALTGQVRTLNDEVEGIKLFRAKVVGMSIGAAAIVSLVGHVLSTAVSAWAK
jgi:hypothetical protein